MEEKDGRKPLLIKRQESSNSNEEKEENLSSQESLESPVITDWRAPATILGIECLESIAFNGIATNLVVYLRAVLNDTNASSAAKVSVWYGTSYFVPIVGAVIADAWLGGYKTVLISLILYFLGMVSTTISSIIPIIPPTSPNNSTENGLQNSVFFLGLFLIAVGCGGVRSSLLPFGADQFTGSNNSDQKKRTSFFSSFYVCVIFGVILSGTVVVWVQENISWSLGFAISTVCVGLALLVFLMGTSTFRRKVPSGSPLKSICQVLVASFRKMCLDLPEDFSDLYEFNFKDSSDEIEFGVQTRLAHTNDFRFLDKAAIVSNKDLESNSPKDSWAVCTITQVEELKILLRLVPIWATGVIHSAAFSQMHTTFIQQGTAMDNKILSFSIPAASLYSFEVLCVMSWVFMYNKIMVPTLDRVASLSQLQRIGIGRLLMAIAMSVAAILEMSRLKAFKDDNQTLNIAWQLPQYFIMAGSEFFSLITQLEFFHGQAPDSMKSMCTAFALLTIALGNYLSSFIITAVAVLTTDGGGPGWLPNNLNEGHLDYYFWVMTVISALNFMFYTCFARKYKLKEAILAI
ncbi:hypothetical protein LUZ60_002195 [Juncus effusus]|nr:hypothetical protein LUZ60_002195 [Juncus effusus]